MLIAYKEVYLSSHGVGSFFFGCTFTSQRSPLKNDPSLYVLVEANCTFEQGRFQ